MVAAVVLSVWIITIATCTVAIPWDHTSRYATHRTRNVGSSGASFTTYHPPTTFETFKDGVDHPLSKRGIVNASSSAAAKSFLEATLGLAPNSLGRKSGHGSDGVSFEYFYQSIGGIPVANAVANVALKNNKVMSYGSSFIKPKKIAAARPALSKRDAIARAEEATGGVYNNWPTFLEYFATDNDHAVLTYVIQIQNEATFEWYEVFVDASSGEIVNVIDYVAHSSYRVVPFNYQSPTQAYTLVKDPEDLVASPNGWHQIGSTPLINTSGNNAICYKGSISGTTNQSYPDTYDYPYDSTLPPDQGNNPNAARVNAFYVANMCHDFTYRYGFTEASFNFQQNNNAKGGAANDRVTVSIQDISAGSNNGDSFATPPDGQSPVMRLSSWDFTNPRHDAAFENDLAGGMGEGWSDALAELSELNSAVVQDFTLGSWLYQQAGGIRNYPYSTNMQTNPLTYGSIAALNEVHNIGEVWAVMWHEIIAALLTT